MPRDSSARSAVAIDASTRSANSVWFGSPVSGSWSARFLSASVYALRPEMSRMHPMMNMRSPIFVWLMSISIGKHEPSFRQPIVSVGSAGMSFAVIRSQCARAMSEKSS